MENPSSFILNSFAAQMSGDVDIISDFGRENSRIPSFSEPFLLELCESALLSNANNKNLLRVPLPAVVIGDIHGNLHDLLRIWNMIPNIFDHRIVFLGDYVDRGQYQVETIALLLALQNQYPDNVFLLRGNHEFSNVNGSGGFKAELLANNYSEELWKKFNSVFEYLPMAAVLGNKVFCVHGGISPRLVYAAQLDAIQLPYASFDNDELVTDIMWSDPTEDCERFISSNRGTGNCYGFFAVHQFLAKNELKYLVRGHETAETGVKSDHDGNTWTVFSTSGYFRGNLAGFIEIDKKLVITKSRLEPISYPLRNEAKFFMPMPKQRSISLSLHAMMTDQQFFSSAIIAPADRNKRSMNLKRPKVLPSMINVRRKSAAAAGLAARSAVFNLKKNCKC